MTIQELIDQFEIQGGFCIKFWREDWNDFGRLAVGDDFELDKWHINEAVLNSKIMYLWAVDGVLNIEIEWGDE